MVTRSVRFVGGPMDDKVLRIPGPWQKFVQPQFLVPGGFGEPQWIYEILAGFADEDGNRIVRYAGRERT